MEDNEECIICFHNLNNHPTAILSCGHKFHLDCMTGWKNTQNKNTFSRLCAICRDSDVEVINIINSDKPDVPMLKPKKIESPTQRNIPPFTVQIVRNEPEPFFICCTIL